MSAGDVRCARTARARRPSQASPACLPCIVERSRHVERNAECLFDSSPVCDGRVTFLRVRFDGDQCTADRGERGTVLLEPLAALLAIVVRFVRAGRRKDHDKRLAVPQQRIHVVEPALRIAVGSDRVVAYDDERKVGDIEYGERRQCGRHLSSVLGMHQVDLLRVEQHGSKRAARRPFHRFAPAPGPNGGRASHTTAITAR
ncbi:hypothetical protein [Burkholderia ambifaria]|uniref:hypothetical protein n=1 Tax=Burkholderia ambifaria TaxID=152480 RepID=UPI0005EE5D4F|nr:hypothetical protein [Burkholderia ambifaria]MBR7928681.1 hypothetical protein [Burkholderia ambifaria]QQC05589.1 hypothetical protein I6H84_06715 [Burkholderia ambifaria]UZU03628.1 hypothetical protein OR987_25505 [Burkholderia ambifaria]UZU10180.1 hypothetical protein OR988_25500 [Burkholderia ambifaria]WDS14062.1 hypothetical protein OR984_25465 [Burkholderia ambifaria]